MGVHFFTYLHQIAFTNSRQGYWCAEGAVALRSIEEQSFTTLGPTAGGGNYDGVEVFGGAIISACQADTSLHVMIDGKDEKVVDLPGKPADIAVDTKRRNVAVPYVALHRVEIRKLK